jgi:hypothetical protein
LNRAAGSFASNDARIGLAGTSGIHASIRGNFAGGNATGVHGMVYGNGNAPEYFGVFHGSR